jgi:hypothetical protein
MTLKTTVESLEGISEALHEFYEQTDNGFVLKVDGIDEHPDVSALKNAYQAEKTKRKSAESKLKDYPDDFDLEAWNKAKSGKSDGEEVIKLRKQFEDRIGELESENEALKGEKFKLTVSGQLDKLLNEVGVRPELHEAAQLMLQRDIQVKDGKAVVDTDMGPMELSDYVKKWSQKQGAAFITPASGGGAGGGKGTDKKVTLDQFRDMGSDARTELFRSDPEHFKELSDQLKR